MKLTKSSPLSADQIGHALRDQSAASPATPEASSILHALRGELAMAETGGRIPRAVRNRSGVAAALAIPHAVSAKSRTEGASS